VTRPADLARRLRERRLAAGLSVRQLAEKAGLSAVGVWKLEQVGRRKTVQLDTLERLCAALDVPVTDMIGA
jgi:transcriptional regulator with XRE-family HTH domain